MKRVAFSVFLLFFVIFSCIESTYMLNNAVDDIVSQIEDNHLASAYQNWSQSQALFGALVPHDEMNQIEFLFFQALYADEILPNEESIKAKSTLVKQLTHLPECNAPSLKNIL